VTVRFEVVTDDTIHYPGLCLDDLAIPELGYQDNAEAGDGGWEARGWVQITADVPQEFAVQVITFGPKAQVHRMELDEHMQGTLTIPDLGGSTKRAVLVVSGLAPVTTEWASYAYQVTSR
jgi:immune inhibitor A